MTNLEKRVFTAAITNFELETGLKLNPYVMDDKIDMILRDDEHEIEFQAIVKSTVNNSNIGLLKNRYNQFSENLLLITRSINTESSNLLRSLGINYIDTAGNAYINVPPLRIQIKGNRLKASDLQSVKDNSRSVYRPAFLQLIFTLLCNPDLENNPYREIAGMANISLGAVQMYMRRLERDDFLMVFDQNHKNLINKKKLLELWLEAYPQQIKPKYLIGNYTSEIVSREINQSLQSSNALLGGESAAAIITNYIRPYLHTIYINKRLGEYIFRNRLKKNRTGNVQLINKF